MRKVLLGQIILLFIIVSSVCSGFTANAQAKPSNAQIISIIKEAENKTTLINLIFNDCKPINEEGNIIPPLKYSTPDKIVKFLSTYWSKEKSAKIAERFLINDKGKYYGRTGDGYTVDYRKAKIVNRADSKAKIRLTVSNISIMGESYNNAIYVLVYENGRWVVSKDPESALQ